MEQVACNLCKSRESLPLWTLPDLALGRHDVRATFVQCAMCGLIYQNPRPALAEMAAHYPPEYELYAPAPEGGKSSWLLRRAIGYGMAKRSRFVTRHKTSGRLLDLGCASGVFLREMQKNSNWQVTGVEINADAAQTARERYGLDVQVGTLEQVAFPEEHFDVVTLWDVLEHLHDPAATLREINRILKPGGIVVLRVPNRSSWDARIFGRYWAGWEPPRHLYVFTPETLTLLLRHAGFYAKEWSSGTGAYVTFLFSLRLWSKAQPHPSVIRDHAIAILYHPVLRLLTAPLFYLYTIGLHGPQMVTTALKVRHD